METFLVRVWRSAASETAGSPGTDPMLRGLVQHLGSGRSTPFRSGEELMKALRAPLVTGEPATSSGSRAAHALAWPTTSGATDQAAGEGS